MDLVRADSEGDILGSLSTQEVVVATNFILAATQLVSHHGVPVDSIASAVHKAEVGKGVDQLGEVFELGEGFSVQFLFGKGPGDMDTEPVGAISFGLQEQFLPNLRDLLGGGGSGVTHQGMEVGVIEGFQASCGGLKAGLFGRALRELWTKLTKVDPALPRQCL